jgi:lysophospholipid acyltransferase (LPLAT)-like uncharacterized protein
MWAALQLKVICHLIYWVLRLLNATYRYRIVGQAQRAQAEALHPKRAMVLATWHSNCLPGILGHAGQRFAPLTSQSKDGDIVAFVCHRLGFETVRGSSSRGGPIARQELIKMFNNGYSGAITVDGPRGPVHQPKLGVIAIAREAQVGIVPLCALADRYWQLSSWDRLKVPKPFARIVICYGQSMQVPSSTDPVAYPALADALTTQLHQTGNLAKEALTSWVLQHGLSGVATTSSNN